MKRIILKYSTLVLIFILNVHIYASGTRGTSGADFLELGVGARPVSMGEAFTAVPKDMSTLYYNPAGLGTLQFPNFAVDHQGLIEDSRMETIYGAIPFKKGYFGIGSTLFWVPPFDKVDIDGNSDGKVNFYNSNNVVGYGRRFGSLNFGTAIKYIYQRVDTLNTHSLAMDFGIMKSINMYSPFESPTRNLTLGMAFQNIGSKVEDDPLPRLLRMGASYRMTEWFMFNMDLVENFIDSSDLYDFTYGFDESFRIHTGMEINYKNILAIRGGYRFNDGINYSMGCGVNYVIRNIAMIIDTAYANNVNFGPTYSINLTFKIIPKIVTQEDKKFAEKFYQDGIRYYVADDIDSALDAFKKSSDYNPYHKNVGDKIQDLEELIELKKEEKKMNVDNEDLK